MVNYDNFQVRPKLFQLWWLGRKENFILTSGHVVEENGLYGSWSKKNSEIATMKGSPRFMLAKKILSLKIKAKKN